MLNTTFRVWKDPNFTTKFLRSTNSLVIVFSNSTFFFSATKIRWGRKVTQWKQSARHSARCPRQRRKQPKNGLATRKRDTVDWRNPVDMVHIPLFTRFSKYPRWCRSFCINSPMLYSILFSNLIQNVSMLRLPINHLCLDLSGKIRGH